MWRLRAAHERWGNRLARAVAFSLPRRVVLWACVRVGAYATTGPYANTPVGEVGLLEALERWDA